MENTPGHWVLASTGKKVLRPGGKNATTKLMKKMDIKRNDFVVELAPGMGYTAKLVFSKLPSQYIGVDLSKRVVETLSKKFRKCEYASFINASASEIPIEKNTQDKVYGEAMLTMQNKKEKLKIMKEAYRILKPGGIYGMHEISLVSKTLDEQSVVKKDMQNVVKMPVEPLSIKEWISLLEKAGFNNINCIEMPFNLLSIKSLITDEKFRIFKILKNVITKKDLRKRVISMKHTFNNNRDNLRAIVIVAKK